MIWEDLADAEVIRVDDTYYYTASTMHYSPGAPILRSKDLVNWEYVGHSVPVLDYGPRFDLSGGQAYIGGIWASSLQYRASNKTFYWIGCMQGGAGAYVYTATDIQGPWTKHTSQSCYYDVGLLIDDDDTLYVAYGNTTINVAQLSKDGFSQVKSQAVFNSSQAGIGALEGSRFYRIDGAYYIFSTQYAAGEYVLKSTSGPFGPYTMQKFAVGLRAPVTPEPGGSPHQGGLVKTQHGDWYYMSFIDAYPGGRVPALAPVTWANGWPSVKLVNGGWGASYPFPNLPCTPTKPFTGIDRFSGATLGPEWEWNHNPDNTKWSAGGGLTLKTATVTSDLYAARNTVTHRIIGPKSTATIELEVSAMQDGDIAGLALLRQSSAWVGVKRSGTSSRVAMVKNLTMDGRWNTTSTGTEVAGQPLSGTKVWLRISADITPGANREGRFFYSTDGTQFTQLGGAFIMDHTWNFFMGYRYGIFNYATKGLGGSVKVVSFDMETP